MSSARPDYVPRLWTQGRTNRAFQRSPLRVLGWLLLWPLVVLVAAIHSLLQGHAWGYVLLVLLVPTVLQSVVYGPRAYRAHRRSRRQ